MGLDFNGFGFQIHFIDYKNATMFACSHAVLEFRVIRNDARIGLLTCHFVCTALTKVLRDCLII